MRVRAFTQDDAHIFCTEDQITGKSIAFCRLLLSVYQDFGFEDVAIKFADRPTAAHRQRCYLGPRRAEPARTRSRRPGSPIR